jgi:putative flippase GtrA
MQFSPSGLRELARRPDAKKMIRYTMVSVISVVVSEVVLAICFGVLHWSARWSNVTAVVVATIPSYELNRKWAWGKRGKSHLWKEVVPFWTLSFIGLAFSTWSADYAETVVQRHDVSHGMQTLIVAAAALAAWGVLWVGKFIFFNKVLFRTHPAELEPALDGRTGLPT